MTNENDSAPTWQTMTRRAWFALSCLWAAGWLLIALFQFAPWEARSITADPSIGVLAGYTLDKPEGPVLLLPGRAEQLDGIVQKMIANKESDQYITDVVKDFKTKYADYAGMAAKLGGVPVKANDVETDARRSEREWSMCISIFTASSMFLLGCFVRAFLRYVRTGRIWIRKTANA